MKLDNLAIGKSAVIVSVGGTGALRQHFLDMGLIQGTEITMVKYAPMGDPIEIKIHDYELTLRKEDAQKIEVKEITKKEEIKNENIIFKNKNHPGYGESNYDKINNHQIYHESDLLTFALVGNQNCGKTTLFKALVGQLPIDHGKIRFGSHVGMAYYDQEHESLNYNKTIFDEILDVFPDLNNT